MSISIIASLTMTIIDNVITHHYGGEEVPYLNMSSRVNETFGFLPYYPSDDPSAGFTDDTLTGQNDTSNTPHQTAGTLNFSVIGPNA